METTATRKRIRQPAVRKNKGPVAQKKAKATGVVIDLTDGDEEEEAAATTIQQQAPSATECAICLCEPIMPMKYILCDHSFCLFCYQQWRATTSAARRSCPTCRGEDDNALVLPDITLHYYHETREDCLGTLTVSPLVTMSKLMEHIYKSLKDRAKIRRLELLHQGTLMATHEQLINTKTHQQRETRTPHKLLIDTKVQHNDMLVLREK